MARMKSKKASEIKIGLKQVKNMWTYLNFFGDVLVEFVVYHSVQAHLLQFHYRVLVVVIVAPTEYD